MINQQRKDLAEVEYLDLDLVTKIVEDFENPSIPAEELTNDNVKFRLREGAAPRKTGVGHKVFVLKNGKYMRIKKKSRL